MSRDYRRIPDDILYRMSTKSFYSEQVFKKDGKYFRKYIENTTTHGVARIFSGKSVIRRLFWLFIVLGATSGCLCNIINRIMFLASAPTATTFSLQREDSLTFPTVTICNLNPFRRDVVNRINPELSDTLRFIYHPDTSNGDPLNENILLNCTNHLDNFTRHFNLTQLTLMKLWSVARTPRDEFIRECFYSGTRCSDEDFEETFTDTGFCYTFNMNSSRRATSTGVRAGLYVALDINQSQYVSSSSFDAGVRVAVHTQDTPPRPEDVGVGVPPGTNAFIGIRQRRVIDNTKRECFDSVYTNFTFLTDPYSIIACGYDCLLRSVAEMCGCVILPSLTDEFTMLPKCTLSNLCCVLEQQRLTIDCPNCPPPCNMTDYKNFISYSAFPGLYVKNEFESLLNITDSRSNLLSINVYYETLNIETQTTNNVYGVVALLSDIGGQLGLFLGVSVISVMEFATWIIDEIKNRLFGDSLTEKKMWQHCCTCRCGKEESTDDESPTSSDTKEKETELKTCPVAKNLQST